MTPTIELLPEKRAYRYALGASGRLSPAGEPLLSTDDAVLIEDWSTRFYVNEMAAFLTEYGQLPVGCGAPEVPSGRPPG